MSLADCLSIQCRHKLPHKWKAHMAFNGCMGRSCIGQAIYRVLQKTDPLTCFCNNFSKCTPILVLFSLLQQENYDAQNLCYLSHHTFIMLPLYLVKQTLMLYQCHYYVIIVFVCNL